jgi:polyisoprenoid-binding protein YceI
MKEKYLNTEKYPDAQFIGKIISVDAISKIEFKVTIEGNFKIHGVTKSKRVNGKFFDYGDLYKIEAHFDLKLSDFKVESPSFLINKVDDNLKMSIYFYLKKKE